MKFMQTTRGNYIYIYVVIIMANFHKLLETFTRYHNDHNGYNYGILTSISWYMGSHLDHWN